MSKLDLLLEADRRGLLDGANRALLDEARRRGLVPSEDGKPASKADPELSWSDVPGQALSNFGESAVNFGKSVVAPFLDPVGTVQGLYDVGKGVASKAAGLVVEQDPKQKAETEAAANAVGEYFADRYGGLENLKKTIATDPVGVLADGSVVLTGGGTLAARGPGVVARAGNVARRAGNAIDPLQNVGRAIGATGTVAQHVLGQTTGAGSVPMRLAYDAGRQGGNVAFTDAMRGHAPVSDVVDMAENAVQNLTRERGAAYRANMANTLADQTALNVQPISTAVADAMQSVTYQGQPINTAAVQALRRTERTVNRFANIPGNQGTIAAGLDAMKKAVGGILEEYKPGTQPYRVVKQVYDEIGNQIRAQVPDYDNAMRAYTQASDQLSDLRRTFSIDHKAAPDTTARKLLSVTRNNVNTNYGERARLFDVLSHQPGAENLPYAVAGHAMSSATPRGLQGVAATGTGATALMTNPKALAMLPFFSPRLVGEATYAAGLTANQIEALARRMRMSPERVRQILMASYATDTVANAEDEPEGRADGGRVDGAPQMDSKYRRAYIKQGLAQGRTYGDLMRELHAPSERLADGGDVRDPMREINKRFNPMTPASRRGVMRESEMRSGNIPSTMERVGSAVMDYGPVPAQIATNIAMQPVRAGEAVGDALYDPTLANVTNAGLQTGLAVARPAAALGALGLGYAEAARRDIGASAISDAQAQQRKRQQTNTFNSYSDEQLADIERETGTPVSVLKTMRDVQIRKMVTETATAKATGAAEAQTVVAKEKAEREAREAEAKRQEYTRAILRAESMRDAELARVRRFSGTDFGKIYDKTGGAAAALAAAAGGAMHNWASGGKTVADKIVWPAIEGTGLAFTANSIPAAYNAFLTDSDNPEKAAYMAYARELPPDHPRKAEFMEYARSLPDQNPVRTTARKEYIEDLPKTVLISAIEGVPSALTGANAPRIGRKILGLDDARVPPGGSKSGGGGGANPPTPPEPPFDARGLSPVGSKGQAAYPDPLREYVRKEYRTAVEKGGKPLDATVVNRSVQDAFQGTKYKAPNVRRRAQKTADAVDDFVQKNGRMPQSDADWSTIWSRSTLALTPTIGLGAAMSEPEERKDGGAVARANRAMSRHWEKQNRYARGGTVHRKGMFKQGYKPDCSGK